MTNWRRFAAEVSHVWAMDMDELLKSRYYVAVETGGSGQDEVVGFAGMVQSWIMPRVWDFIGVNVRKSHQHQIIERQLTERRIREVIRQDGRVIQLMTRECHFFEPWFKVSRDYHGEGWKMMTLQFGTVGLWLSPDGGQLPALISIPAS
jgi:hypothetical protein